MPKLPVPNLPEWTNAPWFNSVTFLMVLAVAVLSATQYEWAPTWVQILTAVLAITGYAVKPK